MGARRSGRVRPARRRGLPLAIAPLLLLVPVANLRAQESPKETGTISNGTAKATALVSRIGPGVGNLELAMRGGTAVTQVTNSLAQATSQTLDMGLIGTSITAETCRGNQYIRPEQLPQPTSVDNRKGDAQLSRDEFPTEGSPYGAGRMEVRATESPIVAEAVTTTNGFSLAPGVEVGSGRSEAVTEVLPGKGRQATAAVESSLDLGGAVVMDGMQWRAFHRTGVDPFASASFDIGRAAIGGVPFPTDDMAAFESAANTALAPLGVIIRFPRVERFLEPNDLVRMTSMRIEFRDSPAGKTLLGPILDASRDPRSALFDALTEQICDFASLLLVGDVTLTILSGTGFLTMELGGAEAASSDFDLVSPFGPAVPPAAGGTPPAPGTPSTPGSGGPPGTPTGGGGSTGGSPLPDPDRTSAIAELCESVHPKHDSCSNGAALALGLFAVLATVGVVGTEVVRHRRRSGELAS